MNIKNNIDLLHKIKKKILIIILAYSIIIKINNNNIDLYNIKIKNEY